MTEDKGSADKTAAAGAAPVSDKKAEDTAEAYEQASGLDDKGGQDFDPVMDAVNEHLDGLDLEEREPVTGPINPDFEDEKADAFDNRETDDVDGDPDRTEKPAAKKTAAKK